MEIRPEIIRLGQSGRVFRVCRHTPYDAYFVLTPEPERRRRFIKRDEAIDYLRKVDDIVLAGAHVDA
jgi:protein gp37